ncbi:Putative aminotransferase, class I/classII, pyridoxal phosphate-dependent transferase, major [Septoria linicola]|uniref:Aminotransferase, class I/classII, pyridoxal phosphate-dependent transferase, major n=1 Tax=Septoria linicola TaxID=215465 RepID=A0A9Q9B0H5_9PEZI|nr:putative aminotransferase, class I/classII, pyridoxal phosphate-dependent transferase, major [Septoria linicola]USW58629.1 Putative aminotransferase, class I/classII, pyridoxal phosphate-dependent transferase, major [Septoria linicola]
MLSQKLAAFEQNRKQTDPLPVGIAPKVFSPFYKSHSDKLKPRSKDWTHRLSEESRRRGASTLKASASSKAATQICNLGVARPVASTIPWTSMTMSLKDAASNEPASEGSPMSCVDGEDAWDLGYALNYGHSAGSPQLLRWVTEHVELVHQPLYEDWATSLSCGNTSALDIILRMLCERGDWLLTEAYTYPGTLEMVKPMGVSMLGIAMDEEGLLPEVLDYELVNWDHTRGRKPFVLYMIPCGQNPTGATQGLERRKAIYSVADKHDLIIVEDDPYFFLQLGENGSGPPSSAEDYLDRLPRSYLSLDRSGRVLRLDATSKILSAGLRAGWVTGSEQLINQFIYHTEFSTTAVSGPSQIMMYKLLDQNWGHLGFIEWLRKLSTSYRSSRDALIEACERWLPSCCDWDVPSSGMMIWVRTKLSADMLESRLEARAVEDAIHASAVARGLQMSKGTWFAVRPEQQGDEMAFRLTFAAAPKDSFDAGMKCFRDAVLDGLIASEPAAST